MELTSSSPRRRPLVVAHRSGNRLDSLRAAEALGLSLVEADLRLFHGRVEVRHLKSVGPLPFFWDRWQLAAPWSARLTLDELLEATDPSTELLLDLKGRRVRLGTMVARALAPHAGERRFTVCARSPHLLEPLRDLPVRRMCSIGSSRQLRRLLHGAPTDVHGVSIHARLLDADVVRELRRVCGVVLTWPVNAVDEARRMAALGVDGLISDSPHLLLGESDS